MDVGQCIDLFVLSTNRPQVSSYPGHYISFLHLQALWPKTGWRVLSVLADCTAAVYFPLKEAMKQVWEGLSTVYDLVSALSGQAPALCYG